MTPRLDLDHVRAQFPSLDTDWAFLDNAGGSQTLGAVGQRIGEYLYGSMAAYGGPYPASQRGQERLLASQCRMADLVNAADPAEIVMGGSSTQLLQNLGHALARQYQPGDVVILSDTEHHCNVEPWERLTRHGVELRRWKVNPDSWRLELEDLGRLMDDRTRLVTFAQCSNLLGTIHDPAPVARFVHERGAQLLVDGVAYAPHGAMDVRAWDVDYYLLSLYKVYGPHHALLYGKKEHLLELPGVNHCFLPADQLPYKMQPGNANPELSHGSTAIVDYLEDLGVRAGADADGPAKARLDAGFAAIAAQEQALAERLLPALADHPRIRVLGSTDPSRSVRVPTVSFVVEGCPSPRVAEHLAEHRLGARAGDFYARELADVLDLAPHHGAVRVSLVHYNTVDEVDRVVRALENVPSGS